MNRYLFVNTKKAIPEKPLHEFRIGAKWAVKSDRTSHYSDRPTLTLYGSIKTYEATFWYTDEDKLNAVDERILRQIYEPV